MMYVTNCKTIQLIRNNIIFLVLVLFSLTNSYSLKSNVKFQTKIKAHKYFEGVHYYCGFICPLNAL